MGRKAQTERRINGIADMFTPLVMARLEREKDQKKRDKAERDAKAKRDKRKAAKEKAGPPCEVCGPGIGHNGDGTAGEWPLHPRKGEL